MATMTLNLSEQEMQVLSKIAFDKSVSKTAVLRQSLRLYQYVDKKLIEGKRMYFNETPIDIIGCGDCE